MPEAATESLPAGPGNKPGKRIAIFADGTGNSFFAQESNIWRLYRALDKTEKPGGLMQLARYVPGVGTSGNAALRMIDGVTGIGVPSNVRKLYRFLCWNWAPGDEIYLFGFSRGAFTVRTLASLVAMQGLMPREVDGRRVSGPEMSRNAMAAWLAYRVETAPLVAKGNSVFNPLNWQMNPLISVIRGLRDGITFLKRKALGQRLHGQVLGALPGERQGGKVAIRFMGLFDTVEAYGMPVEELRSVWNRLIWPIRFRNQRASPVIASVRHALSLDDERKSFHPIRFNTSPRPDGKPVPETQEVWFAGVHSDVGGGYPDDEPSYEPLLWIAGEAVRQELIFDDYELSRYRKRLYPQALVHDSRQGMASIYRYAPRWVLADADHGNQAVAHHSVVEKMTSGANGYVPLGLPEGFKVYPANGTGWAGLKPCPFTRDELRFGTLKRLMRRRVATNWLSILLIGVLIALPLRDWWFGSRIEPVGLVRGLAQVLGGLLPGWTVTWVEALCARWWVSLPVLGLLWAIYGYNQSLAYKIKDAAGKLWQPVV